MTAKQDREITKLQILVGQGIQIEHRLRIALDKIINIAHSMPRDEHGAGQFYQARLSIAQEIAEKAIHPEKYDL